MGAAGALMLTAVVLYISALSRAVGVVLAAASAVVLAVGLSTRLRARWPHRSVLLVLTVAASVLVGVGVWTLVIASAAQNQLPIPPIGVVERATERPTPSSNTPTVSATAFGQIREPGPCNDSRVDGSNACAVGFEVGTTFYTYTCGALRFEVVTEEVLARGRLRDVPTELRRIEGVNPKILAAVNRASFCGQEAGKAPSSPCAAQVAVPPCSGAGSPRRSPANA